MLSITLSFFVGKNNKLSFELYWLEIRYYRRFVTCCQMGRFLQYKAKERDGYVLHGDEFDHNALLLKKRN
jgi:hypothetical protein